MFFRRVLNTPLMLFSLQKPLLEDIFKRAIQKKENESWLTSLFNFSDYKNIFITRWVSYLIERDSAVSQKAVPFTPRPNIAML